jgi:hypothetical protein
MMQGKTREDRHSITTAASDAVDESGGWVLDFKQFSNLAICLTLELPPAGFIQLRRKLAVLKVTMEQPTEEEISLTQVQDEREISCSLRIGFIHDDPDIRIHIPAVPG